MPTSESITSPLHTIASILALGVVRLQQRQKELDKPRQESVHDGVLVTRKETTWPT